jgi:hypothetical protein
MLQEFFADANVQNKNLKSFSDEGLEVAIWREFLRLA